LQVGLAGPGRLLPSPPTCSVSADRLTPWNNGTTTTAYGYDTNGNLTQDGSKTHTYDARDELTSDGINSYADAGSAGPSYAFSYVGSTGAMASDGASAYAWDPSGTDKFWPAWPVPTCPVFSWFVHATSGSCRRFRGHVPRIQVKGGTRWLAAL
jgi:YD repeat-containing protein